jgi:hypothetical protein
MTIKLEKLDIIYKNSQNEDMNVFILISGSELADKYDFILDLVSKNTSIETIENYTNIEIYKLFNTHQERIVDIDRFLYRTKDLNAKDPTCIFLKETYRELKINNILC